MNLIAKSFILGVVFFICDLFIYGYDTYFKKRDIKYSKKQIDVLKNRLRIIVPGSVFVQSFFGLLLMFAYQTMIDSAVFPINLAGSWGFSVIFLLPVLYLLVNMYLWYDEDLKNTLVPGINSWMSKFLVAFVFLSFFA